MKPEPIEQREGTRPAPATGRLRTDLELMRGESGLDGLPSWVIFDPTSGNYFRLSDRHYQIIRMMTGDQPLPDFIEKLQAAGLNVTENEVVKLLGFLVQSNLLQPRYGATAAQVGKLRDFKAGMFWQIVLSSYLFFRIPLWGPDRFLERTGDFVRRVFNRWTMMLLWGLVLLGFLSVIMNGSRLADAFVRSISWQGLIRYGIAVLFIKVIHEFAHAYTAKSFGCRVRKMGIAVVFFLPRFYSDLTDAWRISDRKKRALIDSAGILSEVVSGGLAALVWSFSRPGVTQQVAYYLFAVSIINTVFINGNPFIRYDGYYILMDLTGIDNLNKRSMELFRSLWQKYLFGLTPTLSEPVSGWRRGFLLFYAVGAFFYRIFLYTSIILIVYYQFGPQIGIVLLSLEVYLLLLKPLFNEVKNLWMQRKRLRFSRSAPAIFGLTLLAALFIVPLPWSVAAPAEIRPLTSVPVYAAEAGFLSALPVKDGATVTPGTPIFKQENPLLAWQTREATLDVQLAAMALDQAQLAPGQVGQLDVLQQALRNAEAGLGEMRHRQSSLGFVSPIEGELSLYDRHTLPGKWLERGALLGEIYQPGAVKAVGYLDEDDALNLQPGEAVEFQFPDQIGMAHGTVTAIHQAGARLGPSPLLNSFGGPIVVYADESGVFVPIEGCYQVDVAIDPADGDGLPVGRTGVITYRRSSSLGVDMIRNLLSVLRREFNL